MTEAQKLFNKLHFEYLDLRAQEEYVNFVLGLVINFDKDNRLINFSTFGKNDNVPFNLIKEIIKITELRKRELEW